MDFESIPQIGRIHGLTDENTFLEKTIFELRVQIKENKAQTQVLATDLLQEVIDSAKRDVATYLYWVMPEVQSTTISKALNLGKKSTTQYVLPFATSQCSVCGKKIEHRSRSEKKSGNLQSICNECWAIENKKAYQKHTAEQKVRDAERNKHINELATMPYKDYLLTPEWQSTRNGMLKRAHFRCQVCNESKPLHVHHRTYERRGHEEYADLIVLCEDCHKLYHFPVQEE